MEILIDVFESVSIDCTLNTMYENSIFLWMIGAFLFIHRIRILKKMEILQIIGRSKHKVL